MFSDKTKTADIEWRIESFKQEKKNMAYFMIEFEALAMKADTDDLHAIFMLKKECTTRYYQDYFGISVHSSTRNAQGMESGNHIGWPRI